MCIRDRRKENGEMRRIKKLMAITAMAAVMALAGCGNVNTAKTDGDSANKTYKIGVLQYADHPSLDNCCLLYTSRCV